MEKDPKDKGLIKKLKDRVSQSGKKPQNNYPSPSKKDEPHGSRTRPPEDPKKRPSTYPMPTPTPNRGQEKKRLMIPTKPNPNIGPKEEPKKRPMLPTKPYPDSEKPKRPMIPTKPNPNIGPSPKKEEPYGSRTRPPEDLEKKRPTLPTKSYPTPDGRGQGRELSPDQYGGPKKPMKDQEKKQPGEYSTYYKGNGTGKDDGKSSVGARRKPDKPKSPTSAAKKK